ncbi:MAG: hypothetical protein ACR2GD_09040 [Pyrinomonadaceae bacterium]
MQDDLEIRLDKTKISVSDSFDNSEAKKYWHSRTPQERLLHVERLRRINYGAGATERLQRILEVVKCEWR